MTDPDPNHEITDEEFERMVAEAGELSVRAVYPHGVGRERFAAILAFRVPLSEMQVGELVAHLTWVAARADPHPLRAR